MTTYTTPSLIDELTARIDALEKRVQELEAKNSPRSKDYDEDFQAILGVFETLPAGFKMSVPAITANLPEHHQLDRGVVNSRVIQLEKASKLKRHPVQGGTPTFSLLP